MRDVDNGYILRYTHANVASFFFIFVYAQFYFTNFFINLFKFFACLPDVWLFRIGGLRVFPKYNCSEKRQCAALNVKKDGSSGAEILIY